MDPGLLGDAIAATFERRRTTLPDELPVGLTEQFAGDVKKQAQWKAFLDNNRLEAPSLRDVVANISRFVRGPLDSARRGRASR